MLIFFFLIASLLFPIPIQARCRGCDLALASYFITQGQNLTQIASLFGISFPQIDSKILPFNPDVTSKDNINSNERINIPFYCGCLNGEFGEFLGKKFNYNVRASDTYYKIAGEVYHNLTTVELLRSSNGYGDLEIPLNADINVTVRCYCGNASISRDYGLFVSYPLRSGDTLESVARDVGFSDLDLIRRYNPGVDFSSGTGLVFVPRNDSIGSFHSLERTGGLSPGAIAGICLAVVGFCIISLAAGLYFSLIKGKKGRLLPKLARFNRSRGSKSASDEILHQSSVETSSSFPDLFIEKSIVYSYEELAKATDNFSLANKIGQGGFGAVYYAEIRGERVAIKKMTMQATRAFLAELKVLTHVHHVNLVHLMGYCAEESLFLVYEFMENGNLSERLRSSSARELQWPTRMKIALGSARGLEYIHDHTNKLCIHCDIKSANILIDKDFHAKVADFGLAKLSEVGDASFQSKAGGTFGYMAPEIRYGEITPKIDVYAFGVVLYELISGKPAIVKLNDSGTETRGLISMFEDVFREPDPKNELPRLVDSNLDADYPLDSVYTMAQLARLCTHEDPRLRPNMREVALTLMSISSSTAGWDMGTLLRDPDLLNLISGR